MAKSTNPFRWFGSSPEVIRLVVLMYVKYPLSLRNVEELVAERRIDICHETVWLWWNRFGAMFAAEIRRRRVQKMRRYTHWRWHLDEVCVRINGKVLESLVTKTRDKAAALNFIKKTLKRLCRPKAIVTDGLRPYRAAMNDLGISEKQVVGRWPNNRCENSHLTFRRRERAMLCVRCCQVKSGKLKGALPVPF